MMFMIVYGLLAIGEQYIILKFQGVGFFTACLNMNSSNQIDYICNQISNSPSHQVLLLALQDKTGVIKIGELKKVQHLLR